MELDRENIVAALARIDQLEKEFPRTAAGRGAAAMREALYARTEWERAGGRNWRTGPNGEFTAGDERVDGAILKSPYEVTDFSLTMEYRTNSPTGQGGVYFTYPGRGRLDNNALKVQLSNDPGVAPDPYCTGALFGLEAPEVNAAGRQGEWNVFQMSVRGSRVSVTINGKKVLDKAFSAGERSTTGYVALDGVSGGISYRKVILSDRPAVK